MGVRLLLQDNSTEEEGKCKCCQGELSGTYFLLLRE